jgi:glycosyltransferase involved in cell wall biosynthesis
MMSEKVSIIINCYNGEKYLKDCLDSVEDQTYKNYEVIFWDNKSIDNSSKIFLRYANNNFKYFLSKEFTNLSEARNLALNNITGDYVAFLDTDDCWNKTKLEKQISFMKRNNLDISFTNYFLNDETKNKKELKKYYTMFPKNNLIEKLLKNYFISISTVIFKVLKIEDIYFNQKYHLIGDYDLLMRNLLNKKILGLNDPLASIRFHNENETKKYFLKNIFENKIWINLNKKEFERFESFKNLKINYRYNLLKYLIKKKQNKKLFVLFNFLNVEKKIKIIIYFIKNKLLNSFN